MSIFRKKQQETQKDVMHRTLSTMDLIVLGLGAMVGTGIFTVTGTGAALYAGPALIISIGIAAVAVGLSALFFAEFSSRMHVQGGVYGYMYTLFGEFIAWIAGWLVMMEFFTAVSSVASGWGGYLKGLFRLKLPESLNAPLGSYDHFSVDIMPMLVVVVVTLLVLLRAALLMRFNGLLVALKFSALLLFIIVGVFFIKPANWADFAPFGFGSLAGGNKGIMAGAALMFFAFLGFESIVTTVDEVKSPQKTIPRAILGSLAIATVFYIVITLVLTGVVPYAQLNVPDAVAFALRSKGMNWAAGYVSTVAIFTLITVCISMTYGLARMIYGIAKDGLLPQKLAKLTPKTGVPRNATLVAGFFALIGAGVAPLASLAEFLNICCLAYLIILALGVIKLRKDYGTPSGDEFKVPFVPLLPILSILIAVSFMLQYQAITWIAFGVAILIALAIYVGYGYKNSKLNTK